ncbi:MAG TPA: hypothetical protein VE467_09405 [Chryseolinea sp.]|nr:hypothetical protein [Chryseolinea sp.]
MCRLKRYYSASELLPDVKDMKFFRVGSTDRYLNPETLMFDTPYHLIKKGVDLRTELMIEDIKLALQTTIPSRRHM